MKRWLSPSFWTVVFMVALSFGSKVPEEARQVLRGAAIGLVCLWILAGVVWFAWNEPWRHVAASPPAPAGGLEADARATVEESSWEKLARSEAFLALSEARTLTTLQYVLGWWRDKLSPVAFERVFGTVGWKLLAERPKTGADYVGVDHVVDVTRIPAGPPDAKEASCQSLEKIPTAAPEVLGIRHRSRRCPTCGRPRRRRWRRIRPNPR